MTLFDALIRLTFRRYNRPQVRVSPETNTAGYNPECDNAGAPLGDDTCIQVPGAQIQQLAACATKRRYKRPFVLQILLSILVATGQLTLRKVSCRKIKYSLFMELV